MDQPAPTPQGSNNAIASNDNSWAIILVSAIGVWLLFRSPKKKTITQESKKLDSYSKFRQTAMGASIDEEIEAQGIELSSAQILKLDSCLQGLSNEDYEVLEKASKFVKKEELYAALNDREMKLFKPLRKKIMQCLDEAINS